MLIIFIINGNIFKETIYNAKICKVDEIKEEKMGYRKRRWDKGREDGIKEEKIRYGMRRWDKGREDGIKEEKMG